MNDEQKTSSKSASDFYKPSAGQWIILIIALLVCLAFALKEIIHNRHSLKEMEQQSEAWQALADHAVQQLTRRCIEEQKLGQDLFPSSHYLECDGFTISDQDVLYLVHEQTRYPGSWKVFHNVMRGGYDPHAYNDGLTPISPSTP